jgi:hypothetical protein
MTDIVDKNYQAKLAARRSGTTPVLVTPPAASAGKGDADARYRAKLAGRTKAAGAPTPATAEQKPEVKPDAPKEPEASQRQGKHAR